MVVNSERYTNNIIPRTSGAKLTKIIMPCKPSSKLQKWNSSSPHKFIFHYCASLKMSYNKQGNHEAGVKTTATTPAFIDKLS
jgi:hypothetical protein